MTEVEERDARRGGWFVAALSAVGDLGSPFYAEERQRDVWNEASAVGLQLVLWLGTAVAAGVVWLGGAPALPYGFVVLALIGITSAVTVAYARALGVDLSAASGATMLRWRLLPFLVLLAVFAAGVLHVAPAGGAADGAGWGVLVGAACGVLGSVVGELRARRRAG